MKRLDFDWMECVWVCGCNDTVAQRVCVRHAEECECYMKPQERCAECACFIKAPCGRPVLRPRVCIVGEIQRTTLRRFKVESPLVLL